MPTALGATDSDEAARAALQRDAARIRQGQSFLMAHETHGLLVLFQGMDASGKDEAIRDVLGSVDPRGAEFKQFQRPTEKELRHDYLWTAFLAMPARGQLGIFNRSYYEAVLVERVHPERLDEANLPDEAKADVWARRLRQICDVERYLVENGIRVLKFFLHVSKEEQRRRLLTRIERPEERWQFSMADVEERSFWEDYLAAYDDALSHTNTTHAPWHVVPADREGPARAAVAAAVATTLWSLHTDYPAPSDDERAEMARARRALEGEG